MTEQTYRGSCHCGAVVFEIDSVLEEFTKCDCTLCRKKNAVMTKVHESHFRLIQGEEHLGLYQWNTKVAKHHFCTNCGIYTFHRKRVTPDFIGVNVFCLEGVDTGNITITQADGATMSTT